MFLQPSPRLFGRWGFGPDDVPEARGVVAFEEVGEFVDDLGGVGRWIVHKSGNGVGVLLEIVNPTQVIKHLGQSHARDPQRLQVRGVCDNARQSQIQIRF